MSMSDIWNEIKAAMDSGAIDPATARDIWDMAREDVEDHSEYYAYEMVMNQLQTCKEIK